MKTYAVLTAAAALLGTTGLLHAGTIASPTLPANPSVACYIRNVGTTPISLEVAIFQTSGAVLTPNFDNCSDDPLAPGWNCLVLVLNPPGGFIACSATAAGSVKNLRGTLEARQIFPVLSVVDAADLR